MPPEKDSPLDALTKRLYQPNADTGIDVPAYTEKPDQEAYGWKAPPPIVVKRRMPWAIKFLIGTGIFLALAAMVAAYLVLQGTRAVSEDKVEIQPQAPVSIASGDVVPLVITVYNGNPTALKDARLFVSLPEGTRQGDSTDAPLTQYSDVLGSVPAGGYVTRTIQVRLFGMEGQSLTIPTKVEYHVEGSNALLVSTKDIAITVSSSPISVQVQTLSQSPSGQPLSLIVTVRSNASAPVENVALSAQYPSGFSAQRAEPPSSGSNFFNLGTLVPGDQRIVKITGTLIGQNSDQRVFRFIAGTMNTNGTQTLGTTYAEGAATVAITQPFLNVGLSLNREAADSVLSEPGATIGGLLSWKNTLGGTLTNATIRVALSGNALDVAAITGGSGFYRSSDQSVVFDGQNTPGLASLSSGDTGLGSFSFAVKSPSALVGVKNPTVTLTVSVTGQQAAQGGTPQSLSSTLTRTVKVGTSVELTSSLAHAGGGANGSVPPVAGKETLYTVTLSAKNTVNSVGAAKATFTLPSYVRFSGVADAGVTYNPDSRAVTWTVGDLQVAANSSATFQLGFTPSTSQQGTSPVLVNDQTFAGVDRFTGGQVYASAPALTTQLPGNTSSGTVQ